MARKHSPYTPEFRRQMIELVGSGRSPESLAKEFEPTIAGCVAIDPPRHPSRDSRVDCGFEGEAREQSVGDVVGEVPPVAAVEKIPRRRVGATGGLGDRAEAERPSRGWIGVVPDGAPEAPIG